jgi:hypothetical protein
MSSEPNDPAAAQTPAEPAFDRDKDRANLRRVAVLHLVMVMAALTLWGAADAWAVASGWSLAWAVALANAVIAGFVISSTLHEWGHFAGARLAGSVSPVLDKPVRYFFMFNFSFEKNDTRQFLWMSWGGILVPWALVLLTPLLVPIDNASRALLLATFVTRAVQISMFEVPVVLRTRNGGEPRAELGRQLEVGFLRGRYVGLAVGALVWLAA